MSDMKCPFCKEELYYAQEIDGGFEILTCNCPHGIWFFGNDKMWYNLEKAITELDRTRKELEQSEICCSEWEKQALDYKAENIALSGDLECTRKALDVALDWLEQVTTLAKCDDDLCREFTKRKLTEIKTALEQKN